MLGQWKHQAILRSHIEALGGKVELGQELRGLEEVDGAVKVKIGKDDGGEEEALFDYVVGADGARSTLFPSSTPPKKCSFTCSFLFSAFRFHQEASGH